MVPTYIRIWLIISSFIVAYDFTYVLLRPRSMPGGDLVSYFESYKLISEIDTLYTHLEDPFIYISACLSIFEFILNLVAFAMTSKSSEKKT